MLEHSQKEAPNEGKVVQAGPETRLLIQSLTARWPARDAVVSCPSSGPSEDQKRPQKA
jgi:hypothetical protein